MPPNRARRESAESAFSAYEEAVRSGGRRRRSSGSISATHLRHITRKVPASPSSSISQVTSVERQAPPHTGRESDAESSIASSEDGMERRTIAKGADRYFLRTESRELKKSLRRKLLLHDGEALAAVEKALHGADQKDRGVLDRKVFCAVLLAGVEDSASTPLTRDEVKWICEQLRTRTGSVEYIGIRHALHIPEPTVDRPSRRGIGRTTVYRSPQRGSAAVGEADAERWRFGNDYTGDSGHCRSKGGSGGSGRKAPHGRRSRSSRHGHSCHEEGGGIAPVPRRRSRGGGVSAGADEAIGILRDEAWAVRHGSVGSWMAEVAAPMERKLFSDFVRCLEDFERRNGLDHIRFGRPEERSRGIGGGDSGGGGGEATVVHLGPTLKAAIKFFV